MALSTLKTVVLGLLTGLIAAGIVAAFFRLHDQNERLHARNQTLKRELEISVGSMRELEASLAELRGNLQTLRAETAALRHNNAPPPVTSKTPQPAQPFRLPVYQGNTLVGEAWFIPDKSGSSTNQMIYRPQIRLAPRDQAETSQPQASPAGYSDNRQSSQYTTINHHYPVYYPRYIYLPWHHHGHPRHPGSHPTPPGGGEPSTPAFNVIPPAQRHQGPWGPLFTPADAGATLRLKQEPRKNGLRRQELAIPAAKIKTFMPQTIPSP